MSIPVFAGYFAICAWVFLAEAGVPLLVPTELLLIAGGVAAARGTASIVVLVPLVLTADLLGALVLFALVRAFARRPDTTPARLRRPVAWATAKARLVGGGSAPRVALARSIPLLRVPAAGAAALAELETLRFMAAVLVGGVVWVALFVGGAYGITSGLLQVD